INSDCSSPLVCAFRRCHVACSSARDCERGQACVVSDRPYYVCQLADEGSCGYNSQCPVGQICAKDGRCRSECTSDRDCVAGQACRSQACTEVEALVDGDLPGTTPDAAVGVGCSYASDCAAGLVCRAGRCAKQCFADVDCDGTNRCIAGACTPVACGGA